MATSEPSLPVINLRSVPDQDGMSRDQYAAVVQAVGKACTEFGFFYIVGQCCSSHLVFKSSRSRCPLAGHQIDPKLLARVVAGARAFFSLPKAEKAAIAMNKSGRAWKGWFGLGGELTSGRPDHKEGLYLGDELPPSHPEVLKGTLMHGPNLWPVMPEHPTFKQDVLLYMDELERVAHTVLSLIA